MGLSHGMTDLEMAGPPFWNWDNLTPETLRQAWRELARWVYDVVVERNELSEKLPWCWPHHKGVVAELIALREWHSEIYDRGVGGPRAVLDWRVELLRVADTWPAPCDGEEPADEVIGRHRQAEKKRTKALFDQVVDAECRSAQERLAAGE
jgi:hypothetical protein